MAVVTISRKATPEEMAAEIDRRGAVIEHYEGQLEAVKLVCAAWDKDQLEDREALATIEGILDKEADASQ